MEGLPGRGEVIFLRFPYTDLSGYKNRPAIVLAELGKDDVLVCQVTSRSYADPRAIELRPDAFAEGSLPKTSYVRAGKLFTCHISLVRQRVGRLESTMVNGITDAIVRLLKEGR